MREVLSIVAGGVCGLIFGLGLVLSHMVDPAEVVSFLDVAGDWNPSLGFVMAGGIVLAAPAFWIARRAKHGHALLGDVFHLPDRFRITRDLVLGSALFGIGWGLAGICPGPGIVLLGTLDTGALYFVPAVIVGMFLAHWRPARVVASN